MNVDFSVLNQKGSPALYASALANRPAAGFIGRIFIDTDNPSTGIYRDTGAAWISLSGGGGGGGITGSGTANKFPMFTGSSVIGDSALTYVPGSIGVAPGLSLGTNYNFTCNFTGSAAQPIGFYIYEGVATGFNFQRVVGSPNYNSIYSGNSDMEFKLFDGATDYYHRWFKNGRVVINGTTDTGYQFRVNGTTYFNGNSTHIGTITANNTISAGDGTITVAMSYSASTGILGTSSNHDLDIRTNNTNSLRVVKTTNRLLINTTTDAGAYNLQVNGTTYTSALYLNGGSISFSSNAQDIGAPALGVRYLYLSTIFATSAVSWITLGANTFGMHIRKSADNNGVNYMFDSGGLTVSNSTLLLMHSTTRGMRLPSMTTAQRTAISSPINGLMVFDSDLSHICFYDTAGTPGWRKLSYSNA